MGEEAIASYIRDLAKDHEDWQVQQAKDAVRLYRNFRELPEGIRTESRVMAIITLYWGRYGKKLGQYSTAPLSAAGVGNDIREEKAD